VRIAVYKAAGSTCTPLGGAMVDLWHCDADGAYSDVAAENTAGQTFLRGYQLTDANGVATFATIYPGWYRGRTVHIHFKVRTLSPSGTTSFTFNSQLFFDESVSNAVFANAPYTARGARTTRNANDGIYNSALLLPLAKTAKGYAGTFSVGLNLG
jgi:protocatechuate 3,4-dioxygenase beta subunit